MQIVRCRQEVCAYRNITLTLIVQRALLLALKINATSEALKVICLPYTPGDIQLIVEFGVVNR